MTGKLRTAIAPAYLLLCLILGGSAQGVWGVGLLQILAILIIAWAFLDPRRVGAPKPGRQLLALFLVAIAFIALQLLPLPPFIWTHLPGREIIVEGRLLLGLPLGWSAISLAPYDTLAAILPLLPPLAMLVAIFRLGSDSAAWLSVALIAATFLGILLGLLQVSAADPAASPWYLYKFTNFGLATGFFANSNHMASLLLLAIPFIVALGAAFRRSATEQRKKYALLALTAGGLGVCLIGLALNRSLAGFGLAIPVTIASLLMVVRLGKAVRVGAIALGLAALAGFIVLVYSPMSDRLTVNGAAASVSTRQEMLSRSIDAIREYHVVGSGFGTFQRVYNMFEEPERVGDEIINHAHNDYLEILMETGLAGMLLVLLFLAWWVDAVRRMLSTPSADEFAMAGAIGSAAILIHSAVDFPLRTSAIAAAFAMCLALIVVSRRSTTGERDLRPTRHVVID